MAIYTNAARWPYHQEAEPICDHGISMDAACEDCDREAEWDETHGPESYDAGDSIYPR